MRLDIKNYNKCIIKVLLIFFQHLLLIDQIYACVLFGNIASAGLVCPFLSLTASYKVAKVDHPFTIFWLTALS